MASRRQPPIHGLLERYVLACIGFLPAEMESYMSRRIQETHGGDADWRATLRRVLRLDAHLDEHLLQMWQAHQQQAVLAGTPPDPGDFARRALEDGRFAHVLKRKPAVAPLISRGAPITVKGIGFWRHTDGTLPEYPKPQDFVQPGWCAAETERIVAYLRAGYNSHAYCGWSTCRFAGCVEGEFNGTRDFTDGEWGWPEGLAHYVERHAVVLPEEFIASMRSNHWHPPQFPAPPVQINFDYSFWINWAAR